MNVREDDVVVKCISLRGAKGAEIPSLRHFSYWSLIFTVGCHVIVVDSIYNKFVKSVFKWAILLFCEPYWLASSSSDL